MHFSQLPVFHFLAMKATKSETSSPKYAPTMESVERAPARNARARPPAQRSDANLPAPRPVLPRPRHRNTSPLRPRHDTPSADDVVGVAGEEGLAVGAPRKGDTLGLAALLADVLELGLELVDLALLLKVEDDDAAGGSSAQPVAVGREDKGMDLVVGVERVQVLALIKIPQHRGTVLATRGAQRSIGGDGDGVDVAGVADVVGLQLAARELPNLPYVSREQKPTQEF